MISPHDLAERVSDDWYSINPKYRTQEKFEELVEAVIRQALQRYEDGEMVKVRP